MKLRLIINSILAVGTISLSPFASAATLYIYNNTDFFSTTITNHGACSNSLPNRKGITPPHDKNEVDDKTLRAACLTDSENCTADVFLTDNCRGAVIANVTMSVKTGLKSISNIANSGYCIHGSGFSVTLDPNPTNQPCT